MRVRVAIAGVALSLAATRSARADPIVFTTETEFLAAAGNDLDLESFEGDDIINQPSIPFLGFNVSELDTGGSFTLDRVNVINTATDGTGVLRYTSSIGRDSDGVPFHNSLLFEFDTPINAFGFDVIDMGEFVDEFGNITTFSATDSNGNVTNLVEDFLGENGNVMFLGLVDRMRTFTSVELRSTISGDRIHIDRFRFGVAAVPEPSMWLLIVVGAVALCHRSGL